MRNPYRTRAGRRVAGWALAGWLALVGTPATAGEIHTRPARAPAPTPPPVVEPVEWKTYDGYFVRNTFPVRPEGGVLALRSWAEFDAVFGAATVMRDRRERLAPETFRDHVVLAVIRDGLWTMRAEAVERARTAGGEYLALRYRADKVPTAYRAVTPLIVSVSAKALRGAASVSFLETRRKGRYMATMVEGVAQSWTTVPDDASGRFPWPPAPPPPPSMPPPPISPAPDMRPGGWTALRPLDEAEKAVFSRASRLFPDLLPMRGVDYTPLLCSTQVVAGRNYRFVYMVTTHATTREPQPRGWIGEATVFVDLRNTIHTPAAKIVVQ